MRSEDLPRLSRVVQKVAKVQPEAAGVLVPAMWIAISKAGNAAERAATASVALSVAPVKA